MSYVVLARKYRPQSFADLIGQSHVATTLGNAIDQGRIAHAFLFTGVRGVGKTTSARLLAKCLSCLGPEGNATGPTRTPCQVCAACTEIAEGRDLDVQEIDGASYNGVDEVRRLQEGIHFRPARDRYKIYIVDEVHMLSNAAWNAFLKTLEEPPPHVKFIFATTEVHKVPVTILSRCQRYDFKLISATVIGERLTEVLAREQVEAEPAAVTMLAREAAGSMRDAMSLLDQVIAFSGNRVRAEDVSKVLGVADRSVLHDLGRAVLQSDAAAALKIVTDVAEQGFDIPHLCRDLLAHFRDLAVAKTASPDDIARVLDAPAAEVDELRATAERASVDDLIRLFQGFSAAFDGIVRSLYPRAALEMTLLRLARRPELLPLDDLLARVGDLDRRLGGGGGGGGSGGGGSAGARPGRTGANAPGAPGVSSASASGVNTARRDVGQPAGARPAQDSIAAFQALVGDVGPGPSERPQHSVRGALALASQPNAQVTRVEEPRVSAKINLDAIPPSHDSLRKILDGVRESRPDLASIFAHGIPVEVTPARIVLGYEQNSFLGVQAAEAEAHELLTQHARAFFRQGTTVLIDLSAKVDPAVPSVAMVDEARREARMHEARERLIGHPTLVAAARIFGVSAQIVRVVDPDTSE
jgi:DNA polymerase-3 subunit gamma/tau